MFVLYLEVVNGVLNNHVLPNLPDIDLNLEWIVLLEMILQAVFDRLSANF